MLFFLFVVIAEVETLRHIFLYQSQSSPTRRHTSVRRRRQSSSRVCMRYGARADDSCIWSGAK